MRRASTNRHVAVKDPVRDLLARVAAPQDAIFMRAYATFEKLMTQVLLGEHTHPNAGGRKLGMSPARESGGLEPKLRPDARKILDEPAPKIRLDARKILDDRERCRQELAQKLLREVQSDDMAECARRWVMEFEFDTFKSDVIYLRKKALENPGLVWAPTNLLNLDLVRVAIVRILTAVENIERSNSKVRTLLAAQRADSVKDPRTFFGKRSRGRPGNLETDRHIKLILRERVFSSGRPMRQLAFRIAPLLPSKRKPKRLYEQVKQMARRETTVPRGWRGSLWSVQIEPLRSIDWLRITPERKLAVQRIRAKRKRLSAKSQMRKKKSIRT